MKTLKLLRLGAGERLERLLCRALAGVPAEAATLTDAECGLDGSRILFALHIDEYGAEESLHTLLRSLRRSPGALRGSVCGIVVDGDGELYTKAAAQALALAVSLAGGLLPGKPLVEGTGSLYNQHIAAKNLGVSLEEAYFTRAADLVRRVLMFEPPKFAAPRLLMLHASGNRQSNTVWMGREVLRRLPEPFRSREISLQNGTIFDCRGCSYDACLHFAEQNRCFYGGAITEEVLPAVKESDALLLLCPNFNDAVSANITAFFNRLTNLLVLRDLSEKYVFAIVVSGYSGSDLVARQILGAMSMNKGAILPPQFCLMQTANDPGSAQKSEGIAGRLDTFAAHIARTLLP